MLVRLFDRGAIQIQMDEKFDVNKDYVGAFATQFRLTFAMMCAGPAISNTLFFKVYSESKEDLMEERLPVLMVQYYMQLVQLTCFLIFNTFRPYWSYLTYFILMLIMVVIIPILSIGHWIWAAKNGIAWATGHNNYLNAWLFSYPAQGLMNILHFVVRYI